MKHKVKCIEKRGYLTLNQVQKAIVKNYVNERDALGYYECTICLHFHLTSQKDMRNRNLKKKCSLAYIQRWVPKRTSGTQLVRERMELMNIHLNRNEKQKKRFEQKQQNKARRQKWQEMGWTKKNSTLPLDDQKRLLNHMITCNAE